MAPTENTQTTHSSSGKPAGSQASSSGTTSSGGYYKYRCKYFLSHNCNNWVYVNGSPCANCCAEGRD
ncbi:uncharacterized protein F4807DRAFT_460941 [Annulohypoxylon truncatum]|uniref:uncharacterized protein n=1 Tax=Annulohypoxylon truncatum TaxID=327061 RepID=UPI002007A98F|nr:uncharacterized protein F4807DRAFT_460941 [Annulohypoxylon truncatum]KAI1209250.1 hypothetical protein F4807DRAFT_460941 [Annulohypoxylon truncatum]